MRTYTARIYRAGHEATLWPLSIDAEVDGTKGRAGKNTLIASCGASPAECIEEVERLIVEHYNEPCEARGITYDMSIR